MTLQTRKKDAKVWARDPLDWYVEDASVTIQLLRAERFIGPVIDPCCGGDDVTGGNIVRACLAMGLDAHGMDIADRFNRESPSGIPSWWRGTQDFLSPGFQPRFTNIIMNPPFFGGKGAEAFIRKALSCSTGKVAAFVDARFLGSGKRASGLWAEQKPSRIYHITPRPSCPPGEMLRAGGKRGGGTPDFCWLVWDENRGARSTEFLWLSKGGER
jgi:hypothetical protein